MSVAQVRESVRRFGGFGGDAINHGRLPLVELTGGEPLLQKAVFPLMEGLCEAGHQVLLETSGAHDIGEVHPSVCRIVDLKCPSSGETARMVWENIDKLRSTDEVKFVIATREDYEWARDQLTRHRLVQRCSVLFSCSAPLSEGQQCDELHDAPPVEQVLTREALVDAILADRLPVRFQLQMHKFIWPPDQQGV